MTNKITPEQSARIDRFVAELEGRTREITAAYLQIPNMPDCQPEVMALHLRYKDEFSGVTDRVENLRQELGLDYDALQPELQKRLYQ